LGAEIGARAGKSSSETTTGLCNEFPIAGVVGIDVDNAAEPKILPIKANASALPYPKP
jgi:hypothetical protein